MKGECKRGRLEESEESGARRQRLKRRIKERAQAKEKEVRRSKDVGRR